MSICAVIILIFTKFLSILCYEYQYRFIDVPLDHFNFRANQTFKLRYLDNTTYWNNKKGPIFFYTGNEGPIDMFANNTGFMWDIAESFEARLVFAEHRYYGKSLPFGNVSFSDLNYVGYLSSSQALRDYVYLLNKLQSNLKQKNPVIAFGGSYGGMLSAWLRMKYPASVTGAIASSAPIFLFRNLQSCESFNRISSLMYPEVCRNNIRKSWSVIRNATIDEMKRNKFSLNWNLCNTSKLNSLEDVNKLIKSMTEINVNLAMFNYPYETDFMVKLPPYPVKNFCSALNLENLSDEQLLKAIFTAFQLYTNSSKNESCNDFFNVYPNLDFNAWSFQSCTELIFPMCSDGIHDMFEIHSWNFTKYSEYCYKQWKVTSNLDIAILEYGDTKLDQVSNIIFSNGALDPWQCGKVNICDDRRSLYSILISDAAHHLDLRGKHVDDPLAVKNARQFHIEKIKKWLQGYYNDSKFN